MVTRFLLLTMAMLALNWLLILILITQCLGKRVDVDFGMDVIPVVRCTLNYMHIDFHERGHLRKFVTFQGGYKDGYSSVWRFESGWGQFRVSLKLSWLMPALGVFAAGCIWGYRRLGRRQRS